MVELEPFGERKRAPPLLDLWQVVHDVEQARAIALVHVVELVFAEPLTEGDVVALALRAVGARLVHRPVAPDLQSFAYLEPVDPTLLFLEPLPRLRALAANPIAIVLSHHDLTPTCAGTA